MPQSSESVERLSPTTSRSEQIHESERAAVRPGLLEVDARARAPCRRRVLYSRRTTTKGGCRLIIPVGADATSSSRSLAALLRRSFWTFSASALIPTPSSLAAARSA